MAQKREREETTNSCMLCDHDRCDDFVEYGEYDPNTGCYLQRAHKICIRTEILRKLGFLFPRPFDEIAPWLTALSELCNEFGSQRVCCALAWTAICFQSCSYVQWGKKQADRWETISRIFGDQLQQAITLMKRREESESDFSVDTSSSYHRLGIADPWSLKATSVSY